MKMGQLSKVDIVTEQQKKGLLIIPFDPKRLKGASYDISPTIIAMSTKTGLLETVYQERVYPFKYYIYVKSKDTVLMVSREYVSVPLYISGYVVSRVSKVAEGFGHVSTSIDPNWKGALLIAMSNPTNKPIKVFVGDNTKNDGYSLATMSFHYLNAPPDQLESSYEGMRLDLLNNVKYSNRRGIRAAIIRALHPNRKRFTDFFFDFCSNEKITADNWEKVVIDFQGIKLEECTQCKFYSKGSKRSKNKIGDFICTEHFSVRIWHFLQKHFPSIWKTFLIIIALLFAIDYLPDSIKKIIESFFDLIQPY